MYDSAHAVSTTNPVNGSAGGDLVVDGSGTINPAALNNVAVSYPTESPATFPRGVKRSRTPDHNENVPVHGGHDDGTDDHGSRKRGRPPKTQQRPSTADQTSSTTPSAPSAHIQTPRMQSQPLTQSVTAMSPSQTSPPEKTTPTKATLIKALPTVRDHTTDQLNEQGDEYIPKEFDEAGEKKVDAMGYPQGGREYKCRTFRVALRGSKLFMLATECARVLGYRDSYLLFNKNRSLHKIIATQIEKDDLIQQDVLPYSYRSRQIAIVSAKSMFRQFGSRVIVNGRRVRDDYWESKAKKQGFTEDDLAGEKRPGAARARDAAAAEAATAASLLPALAHGDVIYSNALEGMPQVPVEAPSAVSLAPLPVIHMTTTDDPRLREYNSMPRARQEVTGQAFQDRTQPSSAADILNQASHTADFNKILTSQRGYRQKGLGEFYAKPREAPPDSQQAQMDSNQGATTQSLESAQLPAGGMVNPAAQQPMMSHQGPVVGGGGQPNFHPPSHPQAAMGQSPATRAMPPGMRPDMMHQRPSHPAAAALPSQGPPYGYPSQPQQMWGQPPPQPQPSPLSSTGPVAGMPQYASHIHAPPQQTPSPLPHAMQQSHPSQSPRNQHRPSVPSMSQPYPMQHPQAAQQGPMAASMGFPGVSGSPYPGMGRAMYPSSQGPGGQPFMAGTPQPGVPIGMNAGGSVPGWPATPSGPMPSGPGQPGQSGSPLGWSGY